MSSTPPKTHRHGPLAYMGCRCARCMHAASNQIVGSWDAVTSTARSSPPAATGIPSIESNLVGPRAGPLEVRCHCRPLGPNAHPAHLSCPSSSRATTAGRPTAAAAARAPEGQHAALHARHTGLAFSLQARTQSTQPTRCLYKRASRAPTGGPGTPRQDKNDTTRYRYTPCTQQDPGIAVHTRTHATTAVRATPAAPPQPQLTIQI
jgi:hypothetical protein